jgi:diguanylate cyclase (GGDEF)-like protein/PAS domain S-box-containing protein
VNQFYAVWLTVSGVVALLVAWLGWRHRAARGAPALTALMLALAIWAFTYAVFWLSTVQEARVFWLNMTYLGAVTAPVLFFVLVLFFIGRAGWLKRNAYILLMVIPAITWLLMWTDSWHGLFYGGGGADRSMFFNGGPWFYVFIVYSYGLMAAGMILLARMHMLSQAFYRRQTRVMLAGGLLPWIVNILMLFGWNPLPGLDLTPIAFTGTGLLFAYGFFGYRMMDLIPVGRDVLVENLKDAIVMVDVKGRIVDINPKAMEFADPGLSQPFGKKLEEVFSRWVDVISNNRELEGRAEIKLDRPPFSFLELMSVVLKDRQGQVVGRLASWRDITARKQAEEKLRIFFHAVEQNPTAIVITDPQGRIEYVNPRLVELTGYSLEDLRGKTARVFKSGETSDETYSTLWETVKAGKTWEGEILNRKKNGELYWVYELIAPVLDEHGQVTHFVAMQQDITERKHTESELRQANVRLQLQLAEIENLHYQLREEAVRDGLTRLFNRRFMEETLEREISRVARDLQPISVVMMDVDLFKAINDNFGHQAGDAVLQTLGTMLLENTRISDIACRYGGDEMLVVMPGATQDVAIARAEEWRVAFSLMEFTFGETKIKTTLSLGVASFPDQAQNPIELLTAADKALYWAKIKRNQVQPYDPSITGRGQHRSNGIR